MVNQKNNRRIKKHILSFGLIILSLFTFISCNDDNDITENKGPKFGIFTVQEDSTTIHMNGEINRSIVNNFNAMIKAYPKAKKIIMLDCPGSGDDEANLKVSKKMHDLKFEFHLTANSEIASGAVDMYLAGVKRTLEKGSKIGVHSWAGDNKEATDFPRGHKFHLEYINYYTSVGFNQKEAEDFYYFTINAASADDIHWMTEEEITRYKMTKE